MFYWWGVPIQSNPKASQRKFDPTAKEQWKYLHYLLILKHSYSSCLTSYNAFGRSRISNKVVTRNKSWKSTTSTSNWVAWFDALNSADAWTFRVFTFSAASNKLHKKTMRDSHPSGLHKWTRDSNGQENWPLLDMEKKTKKQQHIMVPLGDRRWSIHLLLSCCTSKHNCSTSSLFGFQLTRQTLWYFTWRLNGRLMYNNIWKHVDCMFIMVTTLFGR